MTRKTTKTIYNIVILTVLAVGIALILAKFLHLGNVEYTDNATVRQHITPINTRVQGFISEIRFDDFQTVHKGDTLAIIDDSEFRLLLARAEADYANAQAGHRAANVGVVTSQNNISVGDAGIEEARARLQNAERDDSRFETLLRQGAVTQQQYDNVHTAYLSAKARYEQVTRARQSTALAKDEQTVRLSQNEAAIRLAEANVEIARLNLSYCVIIATADGIAGKKEVNVGQLVQPGQGIVRIVDEAEKWIDANYRESQLKNIKPGCEVSIEADAVPGETYCGVVESLSGATGSAFSLVPVDNASGNFVKVEQRLPIRIKITDGDVSKLKAGYNVECEVKY
jgi:membrane fusion protein (multidrug efflux system)